MGFMAAKILFLNQIFLNLFLIKMKMTNAVNLNLGTLDPPKDSKIPLFFNLKKGILTLHFETRELFKKH